MTVVLAHLHGVEKLNLRRLAGGAIALVGIGILANVAGSAEARMPLVPVLAMLVAAAAGAEGSVIIKKFPPTHPVATNAIGMGLSAAVLLVVSLGFGEDWKMPAQTATWGAIIYLALGSAGLFGLFLFVVKRWSVSVVVYAIVLMPVVATIVGSLLAREPITINGAVGAAVVIAGIYVGAIAGRRK
jgi:drug/metabolite transporter (DMT)-like permease